MSVVCAACKTENRDSAMFCHGCAGKLPRFAATGPSALEGMKALRRPSPSSPAPFDPPMPGMLPIESRSFWIRLVLVAVAVTAGFVGWYAYVTRRVPTAPPPTLAAAAPARTMAAAAPTPAPASSPPTPVRMTPSIPAHVEEAPTARSAPHPPEVHSERWEPPKKAPVVAYGGPANPRAACAHLNFIAAARCEAAQCGKAAYRGHPRCDQVREQRRRDDERRNPTLMP
ncbi:MAG: hypothetical protein EOP82_23725 [Variovorax sp.]|nr:MAG: hypothetical protein EOP82_23725 [Variovorax sp.]